MSLASVYANEVISVERKLSTNNVDGTPNYDPSVDMYAWVEDKMIHRYTTSGRKEVPGRVFIVPGDQTVPIGSRITYSGDSHIVISMERPRGIGAVTPDHMEITTELSL